MEQTDKRKQDKLKFDRVINLARRLPQPAIHDLLRALILPIQADYLLGRLRIRKIKHASG